MEEHYEVPPASQRVVWLNGQHMKPMLAFEALTRALGWGYNHHKPQVVWQQDCSVRLEVPKVRRVRGHTSHAHPQATPTAINTHVQMGTYLTFYLERRSSIQKCCLVLDGLEAVRPREGGGAARDDHASGNKILITKLDKAANRHTLEYPKGASHDEASTIPVACPLLLTAERLSTSPSKLSVGSKAFVSPPGKLSRTSNRQQSSKASRSGRSCSKRKRLLRLTPARNTAGDDALQNDDILRQDVNTGDQGEDNGTTLNPSSDFSEQKSVGNLCIRTPSTVGTVSDRLKENLNFRNESENLYGQNNASRGTESGNRYKITNDSIAEKVRELTNCSNEIDLDPRPFRNNVINGSHKNGCGTNMRSESSTRINTAPSHHTTQESGHNGDLTNGEGAKKAASMSPSESPLTSHGPGIPYRDSLGVSDDVWSVEADLSSPDEVKAILSGDDSDGNDEWEDEDDEDIYKVVRKCISADITALLLQPLSALLLEANNCCSNSLDRNTNQLHRDNRLCPGSIDYLNNINNRTTLVNTDGSTETLDGIIFNVEDTRNPRVKPGADRDENSAEGHRNGSNCGSRVLEPRNRSASNAGVGTNTYSYGSQDERDKEQGRRGSLDPQLQLNAGHKTPPLRKVNSEVAPSKNDENASGKMRIEGEEVKIDCENMIRSYEQKIRISKVNSNQHARVDHLIEEIIENRWNETKLRKISNNQLNASSKLKDLSGVSSATNHSETDNNTSHLTTCNKPNATASPDSDSTTVSSSASNSDVSKGSLSSNGGPLGAHDKSPSNALTSCSSLNGSSPTFTSSCDGTNRTPSNEPEPGELLMLLLRPRTPQQAWQFQSAHLTVWYRSRDQRRPSGGGGARRPPQRTRHTYRTDTRPHTTRGLTSAVVS